MLFLLLFVSGIAVAGNSAGKATDLIDRDPGTPDGRQGGEITSDAFVITSLPFAGTGNTSDNVDDYDEVCPYTGSTSPDVVYVYKPLEDESIDVNLCESGYDTKLYVYEAQVIPGAPCLVFCPEDGVDEGEPPLAIDYNDQYNSGCDGWPPVFQHIDFPVLCATSGAYLFQGELKNDSDWYSCLAAAPGWVSLTCFSEVDLHMSVLHVSECSSAAIALEVTCFCEDPGILEFYHPGGSTFWLQCRPAFQMIQGWEFNYLIYIEGIESGSVPVDQASWGEIKTKFK